MVRKGRRYLFGVAHKYYKLNKNRSINLAGRNIYKYSTLQIFVENFFFHLSWWSSGRVPGRLSEGL